MNPKYEMPKRLFCGGEKKMVSVRVPEQLWDELEKIAQDLNWTTTDIVTTALDQFASWAKEERKKRK